MTYCSEFLYTVRILMYLYTTCNCYIAIKHSCSFVQLIQSEKETITKHTLSAFGSSLLISYTNSQSCFFPISTTIKIVYIFMSSYCPKSNCINTRSAWCQNELCAIRWAVRLCSYWLNLDQHELTMMFCGIGECISKRSLQCMIYQHELMVRYSEIEETRQRLKLWKLFIIFIFFR